MSIPACRVKKEGMLHKRTITALGAMSGTSLDGVDAAVVVTDGHEITAFGPSAYRPYSRGEAQVLRAALGCWPDAQPVAAATALCERAHAEVLQRFDGVDLIGFHGQTLAHDPQGRRTHQAGDGARLAALLDLPVVWDFRSADVAQGGQGAPLAPFFHFACAKWLGASQPVCFLNLGGVGNLTWAQGGQGAPLAPFFHFACAKWLGASQPVCFLNLGGVGNLTWVDPRKAVPEAAGALLAFDTGPANAPLNDLLHRRLGLSCDHDGSLAASGTVATPMVDQFLTADYFAKKPPKSLDRDDFSDLSALVQDLSDSDAAATLTAMVAGSVACGLAHCPTPPERVLVTGGGRLNPVLMAELADRLDCAVLPVEAVGLDGDMLEAQAFAYLAVRVTRGLPTSCPETTGVQAPVCGGEISLP